MFISFSSAFCILYLAGLKYGHWNTGTLEHGTWNMEHGNETSGSVNEEFLAR
jgi:hypothetical protein